ncbi:MAG: HlyD family type I secretion periplasmic adaptor subunit [Alphaproteobacteria bacterium]
MSDVAAAEVTRTTKPFARRLLLLVMTLFIAFVGWAYVQHVDELTRGEGRVISSKQNQVVQNLEGGIIEEIAVREGDTIQPGQVLIKIRNTAAQAELGESRSKWLALLAVGARLEAEAERRDRIVFPDVVRNEARELMLREIALFDSRKAAIRAEIEVLQRQVEQKEQALRETYSNIQSLEQKMGSLNRELAEAAPLERTGAISSLELLRLRREVDETAAQLRTTRLSVPRAQSAVGEAKEKVEEKRNTSNAEVRKQLNDVKAQATVLQEMLSKSEDTVRRTDVRAPVKGVVKQINFTTIGAVVRPGENLIEIVPLEDVLLIEAKVRPSDIAFLKPGQAATVRITAYDFSVYGGLDGKVLDISADTIADEVRKNETFYRMRVVATRNHFLKDGKQLPITPGMTAVVDVKTGRKTVLDYLLKPIVKSKQQHQAALE